ncbi:MAG: hypothetical protein C0462_01680 [Alcanivorax sp.]|nr:hypothetical protein [Alcanivorax sp.]
MAAVLTVTASISNAMQPLDDAALAAVSGQEGAVLEISLRWNTDAHGAPRTELPEAERRFALRYDGRPHDWLVATDFYLYLDIPALSIDSGDGPTLAEYQSMPAYNAPGKSSKLGSFDPYGTPLVELGFSEGLYLGMNNGIAITRDILSGGDIQEYGWERQDLTPFVGIRIGDSANQPGSATPVVGTGTGPTHLRLDGTVHFFGFGAEL